MLLSWKTVLRCSTIIGNTVVIKPDSQTPLSALFLVHLIHSHTAIPPGVINVVVGAGEDIDKTLVSHPKISKISFTGSSNTFKSIMDQSSNSSGGGELHDMVVGLGGKNPIVIMDDITDIPRVVRAACEACFFNSGQVSTAGSRLYIHESIHDQFITILKIAAQRIIIDDPKKPATQMGPVANKSQFDRIMSFISSTKTR